MKAFFKNLPIFLWILALFLILIGIVNGPNFVQSRGSVLCLSCMGLEEDEDL